MSVKERLAAGGYAVGLMINEPAVPSMVHLYHAAGLEMLIADCEHGYMTTRDVAALAAAARGLDLPLLVRIPEEKTADCLPMIESGVTGILLAGTRTPEMIRDVIRRIKYRPEGERGIALQGLHNRYVKVNPTEYQKTANLETMVLAHIESVEGFENVEAILAVPGVDGITIGAMDFTDDLGETGNFDLPQVQQALEKAVGAATAAGKFCGIISSNVQMGRRCLNLGMRLWVCGTDAGILMEGARTGVAHFRDFVKEVQEKDIP